MARDRVDIALAGVDRPLEAVLIGASAGGVEALLILLAGVPARCGFAIVVVLHLPEYHESGLPEVFGARLAVPVHEALDKQAVAPGAVYFATPGYHLSIERDRTFSLSCEAPVHWSRPSIDVLMESAAEVYGPALAGIVLTGANVDGAEGLARIKECGGLTIVQDPADAEVPAMPEAAIARCAPDVVLPLDGLRLLLGRLHA